jgi:hypothetical protein
MIFRQLLRGIYGKMTGKAFSWREWGKSETNLWLGPEKNTRDTI